jgi:hypothetical protein
MKIFTTVLFRLALAFLPFVLAPGAAQAGLIQATVSFSALPDPSLGFAGFTIFSGGPVPVVGTAEFTTTIDSITWTLDLSDTGFTIDANCPASGGNCSFPGGLSLSLTNLVFSPPADLVGITELPSSPTNALVVDPPIQLTVSSVVINFAAYDKTTSGVETIFAAEFDVQPRAVTPVPSALVLLTVGALGAAALAIRRARA